MIDIMISAPAWGLMAAALARGGRALVLEEIPPGRHELLFRRGGYTFPMGPLSFSFPGRVGEFLAQAGVSRRSLSGGRGSSSGRLSWIS